MMWLLGVIVFAVALAAVMVALVAAGLWVLRRVDPWDPDL